MTVPDKEAARDQLIARRAELESLSETSEESRGAVELDQARVGRLSRMDAMQAQAMSKAVEQRRQQELRRIEAALARVDEGEYGFCVTCGEEVGTGRLGLDPAAAQCAKCAT